jgi:hypothetical protein
MRKQRNCFEFLPKEFLSRNAKQIATHEPRECAVLICAYRVSSEYKGSAAILEQRSETSALLLV